MELMGWCFAASRRSASRRRDRRGMRSISSTRMKRRWESRRCGSESYLWSWRREGGAAGDGAEADSYPRLQVHYDPGRAEDPSRNHYLQDQHDPFRQQGSPRSLRPPPSHTDPALSARSSKQWRLSTRSRRSRSQNCSSTSRTTSSCRSTTSSRWRIRSSCFKSSASSLLPLLARLLIVLQPPEGHPASSNPDLGPGQ